MTFSQQFAPHNIAEQIEQLYMLQPAKFSYIFCMLCVLCSSIKIKSAPILLMKEAI